MSLRSCYQTLWTQQKKSFPQSFHQKEKIGERTFSTARPFYVREHSTGENIFPKNMTTASDILSVRINWNKVRIAMIPGTFIHVGKKANRG